MASPFEGIDAPTVQIFPKGREGKGRGGKGREGKGREGEERGGEGREGREGEAAVFQMGECRYKCIRGWNYLGAGHYRELFYPIEWCNAI